MNQARAILHFNKFKTFKNEYVTDTLKGHSYQIIKVKLVKLSDSEYDVKITVRSELDKELKEIDSIYANQNFKETNR